MTAFRNTSHSGTAVVHVPAYSEGLLCHNRKALEVCEFDKGVSIGRPDVDSLNKSFIFKQEF